ncbi:MAG: hypothetical protein MSG64_20930 [Pyrinomonadaceae bacterium MAG19_C2-C3]|nr:hypothetical protein [Pyrinomonadaceae bacterium MAG19_C2-C3]
MNNPTLYIDPDGLKVRVCDGSGNCVVLTDQEARDTLFNRKNHPEIVRKNGKIYDEEGNVTGTYQRISFDDWSDFQNGVVFGNRNSVGLVDQAPAAGRAALAIAGTGAVLGATGGAAAYVLGPGGAATTLGVGGVATARTKLRDILRNAAKGKASSSRQFSKPGGVNQANRDFDSLTQGAKVQSRPGGIRTAELGDGTKVIVRPSSSGGKPTLEVQPPRGGGRPIKVRYD